MELYDYFFSGLISTGGQHKVLIIIIMDRTDTAADENIVPPLESHKPPNDIYTVSKWQVYRYECFYKRSRSFLFFINDVFSIPRFTNYFCHSAVTSFIYIYTTCKYTYVCTVSINISIRKHMIYDSELLLLRPCFYPTAIILVSTRTILTWWLLASQPLQIADTIISKQLNARIFSMCNGIHFPSYIILYNRLYKPSNLLVPTIISNNISILSGLYSINYYNFRSCTGIQYLTALLNFHPKTGNNYYVYVYIKESKITIVI